MIKKIDDDDASTSGKESLRRTRVYLTMAGEVVFHERPIGMGGDD